VAICPPYSAMEGHPCTKVGYPGDVGTQRQGLATFGTRELACTTRACDIHPHRCYVLLDPRRNRIFLEGLHRVERRFSPGLHRTSQQSVLALQGYCAKMYVHLNSFTAARRASFSFNNNFSRFCIRSTSDFPERRENDGRTTAESAGETGCP
jgi:hypothetical protein